MMNTMTAKENMSRFSYTYLLGDVIVVTMSLFFGKYWLINTQVAFICSMLITFAAFYGYRKSIRKGIENSNAEEFREPLDELLDPYNLYDDEDIQEDKSSKQKKEGVFRYVVKGFASGISGAINPIRLLSYGILILSFLYLNKVNVFNPFAFFIGLSVVPVSSIFVGIYTKLNYSTNELC